MSHLIDTVTIDAGAKPRILSELAKKHISGDTLYMNIGKIKDLVYHIKYGDKKE